MTVVLHLPMPPSVNAATRVGRNKVNGKPFVYSSREKQRFFADAGMMYLAQKRITGFVKGPFTYHLILNEKLRHGNADGDNRMKYALDFAQKVGLIENDKLAEGGSWAWGPCEHGAMLSIHPVSNRVTETKDDAEAA
jgi:Holliday junction resolvase RusA-like endonuclease